MITVSYSTDSNGKFVGPGSYSVELGDTVGELEIEAVWNAIKDGRFEQRIRSLLERECETRGLDSKKLLK